MFVLLLLLFILNLNTLGSIDPEGINIIIKPLSVWPATDHKHLSTHARWQS